MDQLPRLGKRELICLLSFTCNYVVFVWRGFLFLWVLGMGYVILLWHSLSLPYNYFGFEGGTLVLIALVPGHCLPFTFSAYISNSFVLSGRNLNHINHSLPFNFFELKLEIRVCFLWLCLASI